MKSSLASSRRTLPFSTVLLTLLVSLSGCGTSFHEGAQRGAIHFAYSYYGKGEYARALGKIADAESKLEIPAGRQAEVCFLKGQCVEALGHRGEAASLYEFLLKTYPDSEFAARAKGRLEELRQKP